MDAYISKALAELQEKSLKDIQVETALTWGGRAIAAMVLGMHDDVIVYAHEAIEHAALSGDDSLLSTLREQFYARGLDV